MAPDPAPERLRPLVLLARIVAMLAVVALFAVAFLVAPLAVLAIFAVGLAAVERARRANGRAAPPPGR